MVLPVDILCSVSAVRDHQLCNIALQFWYANSYVCTASISLCGTLVWEAARNPEAVPSFPVTNQKYRILLYKPSGWCPDSRASVTSVVIMPNGSQCSTGALWEVLPRSSSRRSPGWWGIPPWWASCSNSLLHLGLRAPAPVSVLTSPLRLSVLLWMPVLGGFSHSDPNIHPMWTLAPPSGHPAGQKTNVSSSALERIDLNGEHIQGESCY